VDFPAGVLADTHHHSRKFDISPLSAFLPIALLAGFPLNLSLCQPGLSPCFSVMTDATLPLPVVDSITRRRPSHAAAQRHFTLAFVSFCRRRAVMPRRPARWRSIVLPIDVAHRTACSRLPCAGRRVEEALVPQLLSYARGVEKDARFSPSALKYQQGEVARFAVFVERRRRRRRLAAAPYAAAVRSAIAVARRRCFAESSKARSVAQ